MTPDSGSDALWSSADAYEQYVGRWSRHVAAEFLRWLDASPGQRWLDVGCGTGVLTSSVIEAASPASICGVDPSPAFLAAARRRAPSAGFTTGAAQALPLASVTFDRIVSGLVLNFVPAPARAASEFARVLRPGGVAALYLWDYAGEMQMMRHFWDAAIALDPAALDLDEGRRCDVCDPDALETLFRGAGLGDVTTRAIDIPTVFADFDDYWRPFLAGRAPAPAYAMSLDEHRRSALREEVRRRLPIQSDGSIPLIARAWAVRGTAP